MKLTRRQGRILGIVRDRAEPFVSTANEQPTLRVLIMLGLVEQVGPKRFAATQAGRDWTPPEKEPNPLDHYSAGYQNQLKRRARTKQFWDEFNKNRSDE